MSFKDWKRIKLAEEGADESEATAVSGEAPSDGHEPCDGSARIPNESLEDRQEADNTTDSPLPITDKLAPSARSVLPDSPPTALGTDTTSIPKAATASPHAHNRYN